jgi:hypothetical protein
MVNIKSNSLKIQETAVDVRLVNGQHSCQINSRLFVFKDQRLNVIADRDNLQMDTHVNLAQPVKSKAQLTLKLVLLQDVPDNIKFNFRLTI